MILVENVRFYDDCIRFDNTSHKYSDIYRVYHISARYNEFGGRVERSSYVILFTDKTSLDLDGYTTIEFTEKEILPLLKEKGFKINTVDSERDLPWYTEQD